MATDGLQPVYDPDEVTPEWLSQVLTAAGALSEGRVTGVEAAQIGTGQVGCNVRYRLTYEGSGPGPASVVGKFASRSEESRAAGVQTLTYETEVAFYRDLADTVEVARPGCYFAAVEPGTADVVLILEDIDAPPGDQLAGCTHEQARAVVVEAAKLHGPRWGDPALREVPWLAAKLANAFEPGPAAAMMWPTFLDRYRPALTEESIEVGTRLCSASTWLDPDPARATICHCDYRLDNMLFGNAGGSRPVTIVDWQTVQLGHGVSDVSYFVSAAMEPERRRAEERALVEAYYAALSAYDIGDYSWGECWDDYRRHAFGGFFMAVFASVVVGRTERGDAMFMKMANGAAAQVTDLGALEFLR
jgi:hypothetical protein